MKAAVRNCMVVMLVMGWGNLLFCEETSSNAVSFVRAKIDNCLAALPSGDRGHPRYMREFGMPGELDDPEMALGFAVSNYIDVVYSNFTALAQMF
jgi:hypothetical protein